MHSTKGRATSLARHATGAKRGFPWQPRSVGRQNFKCWGGKSEWSLLKGGYHKKGNGGEGAAVGRMATDVELRWVG